MSSVLTSLNAEWRRLAFSRKSRAAVARWAAKYTVLDGLSDLDGILRRREDREIAPQVLRALVELAADDELAARTLLQALLPGLVSFAKRSGVDDVASRIDEMVSLAWERIRTYPLHRGGSVAANVLWDARSRYWKEHRDRRCVTGLPDTGERIVSLRSVEEEAIDLFTLSDLVEACRRGGISRSTYELIVRTRLVGTPLRVVANEEGQSYNALAERRRQAEERLREELPHAG